MLIKIENVSRRVTEDVTATLGSDDWLLGTEEAEDPDNDLQNVFINNEFVIMKILGESIILDMGGIKVDISAFDFSKVVIE